MTPEEANTVKDALKAINAATVNVGGIPGWYTEPDLLLGQTLTQRLGNMIYNDEVNARIIQDLIDEGVNPDPNFPEPQTLADIPAGLIDRIRQEDGKDYGLPDEKRYNLSLRYFTSWTSGYALLSYWYGRPDDANEAATGGGYTKADVEAAYKNGYAQGIAKKTAAVNAVLDTLADAIRSARR